MYIFTQKWHPLNFLKEFIILETHNCYNLALWQEKEFSHEDDKQQTILIFFINFTELFYIYLFKASILLWRILSFRRIRIYKRQLFPSFFFFAIYDIKIKHQVCKYTQKIYTDNNYNREKKNILLLVNFLAIKKRFVSFMFVTS